MTDIEKFRLSLLYPAFRPRVEYILVRMVQRGWPEPYIGSTLRSEAEQLEALKRGTTGRKQKRSWHFRFTNRQTKETGARAVDFRYRLPNGEPDPTTKQEAFFLALFEEAEAMECRSLAYVRDAKGFPVKLYINGGRLWDAGHVEYRHPFKSLSEAIDKEGPQLDISDDETPVDDPDDDLEGSRSRALGLALLPPSPFRT